MFNTLPYNSFPASTEKFNEGKNDAIQAEIDAIKDGTNIDSFGDVETALALKANSADMETALATKTNLSNIAPTFDAESGVYEIGDQVIYEGVLYEFTSAHSTAGDWDSSEVQAVKISELIDTLKSGLNDQTVPQLVTTVALASGLSGAVTCVKIGQLVLVSGYCSGTMAQNDEIVQNLPAYRGGFDIQDCRYPAILDGNITSPVMFTASTAISVVAACSSVNFFLVYVTN